MEHNIESYVLHDENDREYLTFPMLDGYPELKHLFTTRIGGVSEGPYESWNFGFSSGDDPEKVRENYQRLAAVMGTDLEHCVTSAQTHTTNVRVMSREDGGKGLTKKKDFQDIDGMITNEPGLALITAHADCTPVFFFDPVKKVIGLAHSGWKGTLGRISQQVIQIMKEQFACQPEEILTGIGPSLCQDCFEVDEDVAMLFFREDERYHKYAYQKGCKYYLDLWKINELILQDNGILESHIQNMNLCTKCQNHLLFSHRGQNGKRGIMAATMMLTSEIK